MEAGDRVTDEVVTVARVIVRGHGQWAVLEAADHNGEPIRIVGTTLGFFAEPGRRIRVHGTWKQDAVYGLQLRVRQARPELQPAQPPPDVDALLRRIPHVGDKRAQMLVDSYGANAVLNAIDADPRHAFLRVARLPYRHAADASRWWRQQRRHPSARDS
jgi:hypothetical protein